MKSRIEKSIQELDNRLQQIYDCIGELETLELTRPFDEERKKREESYNLSSTQAASSHQSCLNRLLEALFELDTRADPDVTTRPDSSGGGGLSFTTQVRVQDSLKPFVLTKEHSPLEFNQWASMFRAFYHSSHLERLENIGQIAFFKRFLGPSLTAILETKIDVTSPVFDDETRPGVESCFKILENEFLLNHPIQARRFQFFSLKQEVNESFSNFMARLQLQGKYSNLEKLGIEGLYIYCAIVGLNKENLELKEKLLELKDLTMSEVNRVARSYESAHSAIKKMASNSEPVVVNRHRNKRFDSDEHDKKFIKGRTPQERRQWLRKKGLCRNCGHHEKGRSCWAEEAEADCFRCGNTGHLAHLCPEDYESENSSSDETDQEEGGYEDDDHTS